MGTLFQIEKAKLNYFRSHIHFFFDIRFYQCSHIYFWAPLTFLFCNGCFLEWDWVAGHSSCLNFFLANFCLQSRGSCGIVRVGRKWWVLGEDYSPQGNLNCSNARTPTAQSNLFQIQSRPHMLNLFSPIYSISHIIWKQKIPTYIGHCSHVLNHWVREGIMSAFIIWPT